MCSKTSRGLGHPHRSQQWSGDSLSLWPGSFIVLFPLPDSRCNRMRLSQAGQIQRAPGSHVNVGHGCRYVTATRMPHDIKVGDGVSYQILRNGIALDSIAKELASWSLLQHLHGILNYAR